MYANAMNRSIRSLGRSFAAILSGALLAAQAFAQVSADVKACANQKGDEAIAACTRAIEAGGSNKSLAAVYFNRAIEWDAKKNFDRAIADYTAAIKINPRHYEAFYNRGNAYSDKRDYDRAIADFTEATKIDPQNSEAFNNRGNAYRNKRDYDLAIADYNEAIRLNPKRALHFRNRGNALQEKRDYEKALASFNEAIKLDPSHAGAADSAAWLMATAPDAKVRDGKRAVALALKACELTQWKNASYVDTLAAAYAESGDYAEAVRREQQALAIPEFEQAEGKNAHRRLALYKAGKPSRLPAAGAK